MIKNPEVLATVDSHLCAIWDAETEGGLWELNCLIYAGAETAIEEMRRTAKGGDGTRESHKNPEDDADVEEEWSELLWDQPRDSSENTGPPPPPTPAAAEAQGASVEKQTGRARKQAIKDLSRIIGWLEAEISRQKGAGPKKCTKKRCIMLRKLSKLTGGRVGRLDLKRLLCLREKQKALLRVGVMKHRRARMLKARQRRNEELIRAGPKSLNPKGTRQETSQDQAKAIASLWGGIWETEGTYHRNHPVLKGMLGRQQ